MKGRVKAALKEDPRCSLCISTRGLDLAFGSGIWPRSRTAMQGRDLMAVDVIVIPLAATVTEAAEILRSGHLSGAPVVDRRGSPVGVVSVSDVAFGWGQEDWNLPRARRLSYMVP